MTNYKIIKNSNNNENNSENESSNTIMPAENRKRHKPERGLPRK